jgi:hypothetical protein
MKTNKINLRGRRVLSDCQWALSRYSETLSGEPLRVAWVSIVTLLRAVGHVLYKVDAKADADVAYVIEQKWNALKRTRPKPEILWEFIESERNSIVKQYEFGFARTIVVTQPPEGQGGAVIKVDLLSVSGGPLPPQDFPEWNP